MKMVWIWDFQNNVSDKLEWDDEIPPLYNAKKKVSMDCAEMDSSRQKNT